MILNVMALKLVLCFVKCDFNIGVSDFTPYKYLRTFGSENK